MNLGRSILYAGGEDPGAVTLTTSRMKTMSLSIERELDVAGVQVDVVYHSERVTLIASRPVNSQM